MADWDGVIAKERNTLREGWPPQAKGGKPCGGRAKEEVHRHTTKKRLGCQGGLPLEPFVHQLPPAKTRQDTALVIGTPQGHKRLTLPHAAVSTADTVLHQRQPATAMRGVTTQQVSVGATAQCGDSASRGAIHGTSVAGKPGVSREGAWAKPGRRYVEVLVFCIIV